MDILGEGTCLFFIDGDLWLQPEGFALDDRLS